MPVTPQQLADALRRRGRRALDVQGERAARLRRVLEAALRAPPVKPQRVWLIGSLAWGGFGERSDVDLVVEGLSPADAVQLWGYLVDALHESVDLLRLEELPESFKASVVRDGVLLP